MENTTIKKGSYSHCWKVFKYAKDAGKLKHLQDLEDFSEEHWAVSAQDKQNTQE